MTNKGAFLRQTPKEAGYKVVRREKGELWLMDEATGSFELWGLSPNFAGFAIKYCGGLYEFMHGLNHENAPAWWMAL